MALVVNARGCEQVAVDVGVARDARVLDPVHVPVLSDAVSSHCVLNVRCDDRV
jgi:hypothetical protein